MVNYLQQMLDRGEKPTRGQIILWLLIQAKIHDKPAPNGGSYLLYEHHLTRERFYISGGFRPMWEFRGGDRGGDCADRRLRELRANRKKDWIRKDDWIEKRTHIIESRMVDFTRTIPIYGLRMSWEEVLVYPWEEAFALPFVWQFEPLEKPNGYRNLKPVEIREEPTKQLAFV